MLKKSKEEILRMMEKKNLFRFYQCMEGKKDTFGTMFGLKRNEKLLRKLMGEKIY